MVSRHDYLAFGDEVTETVGNVTGRTTTQGYGQDDDIRKQYTGYERDKESGLNFAQARYYNSQHGRFTSVDPLTGSIVINNPQTFNRYSYALNSPNKFTDPSGLVPQRRPSRNMCSAENSFDDCGGNGGFWGGSFSDENAEYNRIYGGLSYDVARNQRRYLSILENGYDPERRQYTGNVRLQILDSNGSEIYGETL